jgi:hypothetical protein
MTSDTKHPIDLQATSLQSSTHPAPSQFVSQNASLPPLPLKPQTNSLFSDGRDEKHEIAPIILFRIHHAIALRRSLTTCARCFIEKKTRGRDTMIARYRRGSARGVSPIPRQKTPRNSEARFDVFGLECRSRVTGNERTNGTEELTDVSG